MGQLSFGQLAHKVSSKSPLRYPGGKSRAAQMITSLLPSDIDTLVSPFLGGGSVELLCAFQGVRVKSYDGFEPLVNFWQVAIEDAVGLSERVRNYYPLDKDTFYELQKGYNELSDYVERAAVFFVLNRSSFSGSTMSGGMSPGHPRFTISSIDGLADFRVEHLSVEHMDFKDSLARHSEDFLYLDPPYLIDSNMYGEKGDMHQDFDHAYLADVLKSRGKWILSYNDCEIVRDFYEGYRFMTPRWKYGMGRDKSSNEVLIFSGENSD